MPPEPTDDDVAPVKPEEEHVDADVAPESSDPGDPSLINRGSVPLPKLRDRGKFSQFVTLKLAWV